MKNEKFFFWFLLTLLLVSSEPVFCQNGQKNESLAKTTKDGASGSLLASNKKSISIDNCEELKEKICKELFEAPGLDVMLSQESLEKEKKKLYEVIQNTKIAFYSKMSYTKRDRDNIRAGILKGEDYPENLYHYAVRGEYGYVNLLINAFHIYFNSLNSGFEEMKEINDMKNSLHGIFIDATLSLAFWQFRVGVKCAGSRKILNTINKTGAKINKYEIKEKIELTNNVIEEGVVIYNGINEGKSLEKSFGQFSVEGISSSNAEEDKDYLDMIFNPFNQLTSEVERLKNSAIEEQVKWLMDTCLVLAETANHYQTLLDKVQQEVYELQSPISKRDFLILDCYIRNELLYEVHKVLDEMVRYVKYYQNFGKGINSCKIKSLQNEFEKTFWVQLVRTKYPNGAKQIPISPPVPEKHMRDLFETEPVMKRMIDLGIVKCLEYSANCECMESVKYFPAVVFMNLYRENPELFMLRRETWN